MWVILWYGDCMEVTNMIYNVIDIDTGEIIMSASNIDLCLKVALYLKRNNDELNLCVL